MNIRKTIGTIIAGGLLLAAGYGIGYVKGSENEIKKYADDHITFSMDEYGGKRDIRFNISGKLHGKEFYLINLAEFYDLCNGENRRLLENDPEYTMSFDERFGKLDSLISSEVSKKVNKYDNILQKYRNNDFKIEAETKFGVEATIRSNQQGEK